MVFVLKCENKFCIYCDKEKCTLENIELDIIGQCTECIYPNIDGEVLRKAKGQTRNKIMAD